MAQLEFVNMTRPNPLFCLSVFALRTMGMLTAWFMVPLGILFGQIHKGYPSRYGQWTGAYWDKDGFQLTHRAVPQIRCAGLWKLYDIPDEPGIGLYEPTVSAIYFRYGWTVTVMYQLGFRNMAQGIPYIWHQDSNIDTPASLRTWTFFGMQYGYKQYEDWRSYTDGQVGAGEITNRRFYLVPDFFVNKADAI
jgi:hypothetical protein